MSYRFMRVILFFDLPTKTLQDKRAYRQFHKILINNGFLMMQESVYCRMLINQSAVRSVVDIIRKNRPPTGIVQLLVITEKQFANMEFITGESETEIISSDERLIFL